MKKVLCLLTVLVMCVLMGACGVEVPSEVDTSVDYSYDESYEEPTVDAYAEAEEEALWKCESYIGENTVSNFQVATSSSKDGSENEKIVTLSGSFYSEDKYGDAEGKYVFDITVSVDMDSGLAYVEKSDIRKKY